jgi:hypothetical protein
VSVKELGRRLHRDPSVISRLYSAYAAARDEKKDADLLRVAQYGILLSLGTDLGIARYFRRRGIN